MINLLRRQNRASERSGFTLTELAIVLGVVGIILGGIWAVAGRNREASRQEILKTNLLMIVRNVRAFGGSQNGITGNFATFTQKLLALSPPGIPGDLLRATGVGGCTATICADHPWGALSNGTKTGGSLGVCGWNPSTNVCATTASQFFAVELDAMPLASCIQAAVGNSGSDAPPGLFDVVINGTSIQHGAGITNTLPVKASDANKLCSQVALPTIDFVYRTTAPLY